MKTVALKNRISICIIVNHDINKTLETIKTIKNQFLKIQYEIVIFKDKEFSDIEFSDKDYDKYFEYKDLNDYEYIKKNVESEWILIIYSDEILKDFNEEEILSIISNDNKKEFVVDIVNHNLIGTMDIPYSLEQVRFFHKDAKEKDELKSLIIERRNYLFDTDPMRKERKFRKKIEEIELRIKQNIEDPYGYFIIALAYKMNGENQNAIENFLKALSLPIDPKVGYVQMMVILYGNLLLEMEEYGQALLLEDLYEYFDGLADFLCLMGKIYLKAGFIPEAIREFSKALNTFSCIEYGNNTFIPNYYLGCIYEIVGDIEIAKKLYRRCGKYKPAMERLEVLE